jgi:hypothetical protein
MVRRGLSSLRHFACSLGEKVPGKSSREADNNFAYYFRESLSVVTNSFLKASSEGNERVLLYEPPVKLKRKSGDPLYLSVVQTYLVSERDGEYKAKTTSYSYSLWVKKDSSLHAVLEFHWHPGATANLKWPHVHVNANSAEGELKKKHIPTARVAIEDFLRFLIRDYGIVPIIPYQKAKEILIKNKAAFVQGASWLDYKQLI